MIAVHQKANALSVFMDRDHIGYLYNENPLAFSYDGSWLKNPAAKPLDPEIPLQEGKTNTPFVHAFFENLLPEGDQRKIISLRHHVSTVFGLLATVGGDTAGAIVLLPLGQTPHPPIYQKFDWDRVNKLIHATGAEGDTEEESEEEEDDLPRPRLSISGAQFKMLLSLDEQGEPLLPMGTTPSTHILKPDIVRTDIKIFASAVNETIVMRAALICEMPTAEVAYQPKVKACLVRRYDRVPNGDGTLKRLWQADFCQLAGKPSDVKYEADGGLSFKDCFALLAAHTVRPAIDQRNLLRWLFFNLYVGNNDSHAKNLSILSTDEGPRLAPFYDLMSTRVYPGLGQNFAFRIGGEFSPGKIERKHIEELAKSLGVNPRYMLKIASDMADRVDVAIKMASGEIMPSLGHSEKVLAGRIQNKIRDIVKKTRNRILQPGETGPASYETGKG
jgi:serine/threonine-protein kinase HipA